MIRCFLLAVVLAISQLFVPLLQIRLLMLVVYLALAIPHLIAVIAFIIFVFLLSVNVLGVVVGLLYGLLVFVPLVNLVAILWLNIMANRILRRHGYQVGLLGVD